MKGISPVKQLTIRQGSVSQELGQCEVTADEMSSGTAVIANCGVS